MKWGETWVGGRRALEKKRCSSCWDCTAFASQQKYHIFIHRWPVLYPPGSPSAGLAALETREDTFVGQVESTDTKRVVSKPWTCLAAQHTAPSSPAPVLLPQCHLSTTHTLPLPWHLQIPGASMASMPLPMLSAMEVNAENTPMKLESATLFFP